MADIVADTLFSSRTLIVRDSWCARQPGATAGRQRLVDRAKLVLASNLARRWTLADIAAEVRVSPVSLTKVFQQIEGLPLYRCQLRLRLARVLDRLPTCEDLTTLAGSARAWQHRDRAEDQLKKLFVATLIVWATDRCLLRREVVALARQGHPWHRAPRRTGRRTHLLPRRKLVYVQRRTAQALDRRRRACIIAGEPPARDGQLIHRRELRSPQEQRC